MDRVQRDERVAVLENDVNHNEVVNVIQIVAETISSNIWVYTTNNKITSPAVPDLVCNVGG